MNGKTVARIFARMKEASLPHWPFALLAAGALTVMVANLGSDYLWGDEGDTAVLASTIVKYGVPRAWDGVTFTDADKGARVNDDLVMVSHPWAQYYLTAASFLVFGENAFAARFPFALAGWMTILLVYGFVWRVSASRSAAFCAAALLVLSVQFLLYSRQCRNYSINMLFTCWLIWIFFKMKSARQSALFAVAAILLFHTSPVGIVPVSALGALTLIYRPFTAQRRWFWLAAPAIVIFTLPWLALARRGYGENTTVVQSIGQFSARFVQYLVECASVTPLIGTIIIFTVCLLLWKFRADRTGAPSTAPRPRFLEKDEFALCAITLGALLLYGLAMAMTQSTNALWYLGIRYATAMIPLTAMIAGILIVKISRGRAAIWVPLLLVFACTKMAQLTPWMLCKPDGNLRIGKYWVGAHVPQKRINYFLGTGLFMFVGDLWRENPGITAKTCEFLRQYAKPGDTLITNADWDPLYFYTRFRQALKILPSYPIYSAARRKGLPEYVFGVDRVRWVIWRPQWDGVDGYFWFEVQRQIEQEGGRLRRVAELEETIWENRESIHFHRFSGRRYLFPWFESLPAGGIFRVDWPD